MSQIPPTVAVSTVFVFAVVLGRATQQLLASIFGLAPRGASAIVVNSVAWGVCGLLAYLVTAPR